MDSTVWMAGFAAQVPSRAWYIRMTAPAASGRKVRDIRPETLIYAMTP